MKQLSEHFTDRELGVEGAEERVLLNAVCLCETILEPLRQMFGVPLEITSGRRTPEHNAAVGGASTAEHHSEHLYEDDHAAADFKPRGYPMTKAFQQIRDSGLRFRQAILEYSAEGVSQCIHISTRRGTLDKHETLLGRTHGQGSYTRLDCAPAKPRMMAAGAGTTMPDADHEIGT